MVERQTPEPAASSDSSELAPPGAEIVTSTFENWAGSVAAARGQFDAIFLVGSFCHLSDPERQLARLRARIEEPTPRVILTKSEAMALVADHHALRQEVLRSRHDIEKFLKQGAKFH